MDEGTIHDYEEPYPKGWIAMAVEFRLVEDRPASRREPRALSLPRATGTALGQILLERRLITADQLAIAIEHQKSTAGRRLGQVLLDLGFATADAVLGALSVQLGVPATRLNAYTVSAAAVRALPERIARKHSAVPLQKLGQMLQVAIAARTTS